MDTSSAPQSTFSKKVIFMLFGVASLLGWNALLTELGFFNHFLPSMKPFVSFSFLNYILNIVFQFLIFCKKDLFSLKFQLIGGTVGSIIFLILIPLCTIVLGKDTLINIIITGGLIVLMGFINALCSGGFYGLVSNFPLEMIVALSTGQGFSGIAMNLIQYIVLLSISSTDDKSYIIQACIFFVISVIILLICLVLLLFSFNNEYFQYYLNKSKSESKNELLPVDDEKLNVVETNTENKEVSFCELFQKIWHLDLLVLFIYLVTFALFPNASINQQLFGLSFAFSSNTIILIFNCFDTIGRYLVSKIKPSKSLNMIVTFGRSILLFTLVFNYYCQDGLEWNINVTSILLIINVGLLAATSGIGTTLCFGLAPNEVEDEYKGQAGTSVSFFLILGIFLGSCVAFLTNAIIDTFKKPTS